MTREEIQLEAERRYPIYSPASFTHAAANNSLQELKRGCFIDGAVFMESENAALRQQVKDMGEVIKELKKQ